MCLYLLVILILKITCLCLAVPEDEAPVSCVENIDSLVHLAQRNQTIFLLGAQKAGTTYLYQLMVRYGLVEARDSRPDMLFSVKEPHVLDRIYIDETKFKDTYLRDVQRLPLIDASPDYPEIPSAAYRIKRHFSNPLFVIVLRDPIARSLSAWSLVQSNPIFHDPKTKRWSGHATLIDEIHSEIRELVQMNCSSNSYGNRFDILPWKRCFNCHFPFHSCLGNSVRKYCPVGKFGFLRQGLYAAQLRMWLDFFDINRFMVLTFKEVTMRPHYVIWKLAKFLNITPSPQIQSSQKSLSRHSYHDAQQLCDDASHRKVMRALAYFFREPNDDLMQMAREYNWDNVLVHLQPEHNCWVR